DLEALTPRSIPVELVRTTTPPTGQEIDEGQGSKSREESQGIHLSEPTTEVFHTNKENDGKQTMGGRKFQKQREDKGIVILPSRFSPLQGIEEEEEEDKAEGKKIQRTLATSRGKRVANVSSHKQLWGKTARAKDLMLAGKQGTSKKSSGRKL
ncbi:hypothetical protein HID58_070255, partial [Brassica napus]